MATITVTCKHCEGIGYIDQHRKNTNGTDRRYESVICFHCVGRGLIEIASAPLAEIERHIQSDPGKKEEQDGQ